MESKKSRKVNGTQSYFFEKINKIDKPLDRPSRKKERVQIDTIRNEREVTTDTIEVLYKQS